MNFMSKSNRIPVMDALNPKSDVQEMFSAHDTKSEAEQGIIR